METSPALSGISLSPAQATILEEALLAADDYIADNLDAICDDDYLAYSDDVLARVDEALDLLRRLRAEQPG